MDKTKNMKCQHENCTREARINNQLYFKDKWYCTYHANKETKQGRLNKKIATKKLSSRC